MKKVLMYVLMLSICGICQAQEKEYAKDAESESLQVTESKVEVSKYSMDYIKEQLRVYQNKLDYENQRHIDVLAELQAKFDEWKAYETEANKLGLKESEKPEENIAGVLGGLRRDD